MLRPKQKMTAKERKEWLAAWRKEARRARKRPPVLAPQKWSDLDPRPLYLPTR